VVAVTEQNNEEIFGTMTLDQGTLQKSLEQTQKHSNLQRPTKETCVPDATKRFSVKNTLGEGAFGLVELLEDNHIGRNVARKSFKHADHTALLEYEREVHIIGQLDHPGIPMIFDVGITQAHPYLLMKYVQGKTLKEIIVELEQGNEKTHARFRFPQRAQIIKELLRILIASHEKGIIHRDIKPANIMVGDNGEVYLMDWGIAMDTNISDTQDTICGTPMYMAPEQVTGKKIAPYTDTFALGMVFYHVMTLHSPRKMTSLKSMLRNISRKIPPQPDIQYHETQGYNPSEYRMLIEKSISLSPENRYQSAKEMLTELENILNGVFCSVCPRTTIKSYMYQYFSFLDKQAYFAVTITVISLFVCIVFLMGIGYFLGSK
jgi:eukaryotic-like serine/threonine-protein kinase